MIMMYQRHCLKDKGESVYYKELNEYANKRLDRCVFGEDKPACKSCPVHCYQPAKREEVKQIMRWAGPRMLRRHPILAIRHMLETRRSTPFPERLRPKK